MSPNPYAPRVTAATGDPEGTVDEALAWVGDDKERAKELRKTENKKPKDERRKTLLDGLSKVLDG